MSEDNQLNVDKNQNKNNLEKIIKLDKKNGNFDIYDKYSKRKLKIRTSQNNSHINSSYQNEYILCYFWRHINQVYFKKIDEPEYERLDYLKAINEDIIHTQFPVKYADYKFYQAKQILNKQYFQLENATYKENIQKHIRLSGLIHKAKDLKIPQIDKLYYMKQKSMVKFNQKSISSLIQENAQLDKILDKLNEQIELRTGQKDEIFLQLQEYTAELQQLNKSNKLDLQNLNQKIKSEQPLNVFGTQVHIYKQARINNGLSKNQIIYNNEALLNFLRKSLEQLDYRQTAESIVKVVSTTHTSNGYTFCVAFEQALNSNYVNIQEELMYELDKLRDTSLFKFYNIPQKTKYSHISQNFIGINQVQHNRQKPNPLINKNLTKESKIASQNENDSNLSRYEACHHCKMLFREEYLISCNYRSSTMGLPIITSQMTDSYLFSQLDEEGITSRRQVPNRKKTAYSIYSKKSKLLPNPKDGELICQRKFCRMCLKQNYEIKIEEVVQKTDWVCPFCQAICFCSRCQRNDIMIKLKDLFTICGGDLDQLSKDSIFEKYVRPLTEEQLYKKKPTQLQRTGFSIVKQQLSNFKDMQTIRLDFENLRLLCSQIMRREKLKWKLLEQDILMWNEDVKSQQLKNHKSTQKSKKLQQKTNQITKKLQKQEIEKVREYQPSSSSSSSEYLLSSEFESEENQNEIQKNKQKTQKEINPKGKNQKQQKLVNQIAQNQKSLPAKNLKREVAQLLQYQDTDTYSQILKKIKKDKTKNSSKR
ncbi:unnamed protein product (macronuclear) [Paramecium tetraurelia]|uniref:Zinc-finger domain-containing protein n=1 Tax=Paramecium tetraurelia TaxID=5888 RepID=A0DJL1_PARTE|nr:uncharacterized protein GSPATT00017572001 [Paramecium tetraurelia]CAK83228.1 unnamed protein product [Paramecium tetraurelia]|eukprot:XP_001450625.1 hypothetical protein (macronuclear) [Paramecium tetraurelia strain d4-2]